MDSLMEDYLDVVHGTLVPRAAYLSNLPEPHAFVETRDGEKLYFPGQALFEQLVWNIGVALCINLLASHIYDKYFSSKIKGRLLPEDDVKAIANEMVSVLRESPEVAPGLKLVKDNIDSLRQSEAVKECVNILSHYGWPQESAERYRRCYQEDD